ncbi:MAG: TonB-dependent receptor [Paludibacteraceae bacterium]|nr:TonB-dependent receptor [Paludibacteraceae bacterium]
MHRLYRTYLVLVLYSLFLIQGVFARNARIYGYVVDQDNVGIELANVAVLNTDRPIGTSTNKNGYYELMLDEADTVVLNFSMVGYTSVQQRIIDLRDVLNVNVQLLTDEQLLTEIEVRGIKHTQGTMDHVDAQTTRIMPDATGGSIESLLITFAGVSQTNELSSQYNVRGGSFDENSVYVNGIEVHRPLLIRSGQQEGLSFVNPEMVENVSFSAGGYSAQYGDKMSSVLDITYKRPQAFEASLSASLLGAQVYIGHGDSTYSQMHGIRYKTSKYMLGGLATAGNYQPTYLDYQTYITWRIGKGERLKVKGERTPWTMAFLGNVSQNDYKFTPDSLSESFGGQNAKNLNIYYDGQEKDKFLTAFAALSAKGKVSDEVEIGFDLSGFYTNERENFDITGQYVLSNAPMDGSSTSNAGSAEIDPDGKQADVLGTGIFHQHARNSLQAATFTLAHTGRWTRGSNELSWGVSGQGEWISDHINEWEWRDSAGYSMPNDGRSMEIYYAMRGDSSMLSARLQAFIENKHKWNTQSGQWILTVGGRLQWWTWNNEVLPSPRASVEWIPGWKRDFCFRLATGLYYQAPFYKELRDTLTDALGITRIQLNRDLRAQRSVHVVLGGDYYFRAWGRPFKFTAEAYYKYIDRMESYTVENVRVRYSGKNDSEGYAAGLDLKLYGELVPGADSWISFSAMGARQRLIGSTDWIPSPQEQRWAFAMLFQDYIPQLPQLKFHLKMQFSDGQPYYAPRNNQVWGRMPTYKRIDIGATYVFNAQTAKFMRAESAKHVKQWAIQFEVFNLVGWKNVNSYFWVADAYNQQWASPNYLTGRRYNLKITVDLR